MNREWARGVEAGAATREVRADGDHVVDVDVSESVVVRGQVDEEGLCGVEGDVVGEGDRMGDHVLDGRVQGGGVPIVALEEVVGEVRDDFGNAAPFGGTGLASEG